MAIPSITGNVNTDLSNLNGLLTSGASASDVKSFADSAATADASDPEAATTEKNIANSETDNTMTVGASEIAIADAEAGVPVPTQSLDRKVIVGQLKNGDTADASSNLNALANRYGNGGDLQTANTLHQLASGVGDGMMSAQAALAQFKQDIKGNPPPGSDNGKSAGGATAADVAAKISSATGTPSVASAMSEVGKLLQDLGALLDPSSTANASAPTPPSTISNVPINGQAGDTSRSLYQTTFNSINQDLASGDTKDAINEMTQLADLKGSFTSGSKEANTQASDLIFYVQNQLANGLVSSQGAMADLQSIDSGNLGAVQ